MLKKIIIPLIAFVALLASMLMGIFSAAGVCAMVFGSEILDTTLSDSPDRTHPAFILFMMLMVPGMLVGAVGSIFGIILPLYQKFNLPLGKSNEAMRQWLNKYALGLAEYTEQTCGEQDAAGNPLDAQ